MTRRDEFLDTHPDFHPGMLAFSDDGQELGEVQKLDEENLTIEKGRFFSADRRLPYDAVSDIRGDHLIINRSQADLEEWRTPDYAGLQESGRADVEEAAADVEQAEASVPIYQQNLKDLESTEQNEGETTSALEGPPDAERMETEHAPAGGKAGPMPGGESFRDEEIRIPIMEEEVEIRKRPVVKEEVRARKQTRTEERDVSGEIRKEDIEIERERREDKK
jgi:uncharacterized protein (TIGR02271 family)